MQVFADEIKMIQKQDSRTEKLRKIQFFIIIFVLQSTSKHGPAFNSLTYDAFNDWI